MTYQDEQRKILKSIFILLPIVIVWLVLLVINEIKCYYEYNNKFSSYWELADKSSTIEEKSKYINLFVEAFEKQDDLAGQYNAIFYKTPTESFDKNLQALKSLQQRLDEIKTMDIKSFEYQTAIQQITAQEQGEAGSMLHTLEGTWVKQNYFLLWNWIGVINWLLLFTFIIITLVQWLRYIDF